MKTVGLELAKQLKEAGYPQDAGFWYRIDKENPNSKDALLLNDPFESNRFDFIAAPTADEILDLLPHQLEDKVAAEWLVCTKNKADEWEIGYATNNGFINGHKTDKSLAEAAAKMWLYLKKEGLL